jgi:hypothetical protein
MKFKDNVYKHLEGDEFSNGLIISISQKEKNILTRLEMIKDAIKDKKVIHLGCCDHIPLIKDKIEKGIWLHKIITDNAKECIGIDIDKNGISYLKAELGYKNVELADITTDEISHIASNKWDYIVIGEILEHVNNPVQFLKSIVKKYGSKISNFIITVPNAFSITNFNGVKNGVEIINTDHRYWFTPYTLAKVGHEAGLKLEDFSFVLETFRQKTDLKAKLLIIPYFKRKKRINMLLKYPALRESIFAVFKVT